MNKLNKTQTKELATAIFEWRKAYQAMETDQAVEKARASVERANIRLEKAEKTYRGSMQGNKMVIETLLLIEQQSVIAFGIRAKFRKAYDRITYDRKTLDNIAAENVRIFNLINPHRKVSPVKAGVSIEVSDPIALLKPVKFSPVLEIK